jgi:hypothetical protein
MHHTYNNNILIIFSIEMEYCYYYYWYCFAGVKYCNECIAL